MRPGDDQELNATAGVDLNHATAAPALPAEARLVREGELVRLRAHVVANRPAFQRWYADEEIARLLRHDQRPLNFIQSRGYFDTLIMPMSARGMCFAIHETATDRLVGTSALTDVVGADFRSALFRIVIGEKDCWGRGYGTEATRLVVEEAFGPLALDQVRLEVFRHNTRALAAYRRVGFHETGEHIEFVGKERFELHVIDDDQGGWYAPGPSDLVRRRLAARGVFERQGAPRVVLAFAEPRAAKGRAGFGPDSRAALALAVPGAALVVLFAHERLLPEIPAGPPVLVAWHRQPLMQHAVARWLGVRRGGPE